MPLPAERVRLGWGDRRSNLKALASLPAGPGLKSFQGRKLSVRVRSEIGGGAGISTRLNGPPCCGVDLVWTLKACISLLNSYRVAQELSVWPTIETGPEGPALHFLLNICQERRQNHTLF